MAYYIYLNSEAKGPFTLSTVKENLNTGVWEPSVLCCKQGENEWTPIADLFTVEFVPKEEPKITKLTNQVLNRTKQIALSALKVSPFKGFQKAPPHPSTSNIARVQAQSGLVYAHPINHGTLNSAVPRPAPLNTPVPTPKILPTYQASSGVPAVATYPAQNAYYRKPAPTVIDQEGERNVVIYWVLAALAITAFGFTLLYLLIKWIYATPH